MLAVSAVPELTVPDLEARVEELREQERQALRRLGLATIEQLPAIAARRSLARVREDLEATFSALRILESR